MKRSGQAVGRNSGRHENLQDPSRDMPRPCNSHHVMSANEPRSEVRRTPEIAQVRLAAVSATEFRIKYEIVKPL